MERIDLPAIPFKLTQGRSPGFFASNRKRKTSTETGSPRCAQRIWNALTNAQLLGWSDVELGQQLPLETSERKPKFHFLEQRGVDEAEQLVVVPLIVRINWFSREAR